MNDAQILKTIFLWLVRQKEPVKPLVENIQLAQTPVPRIPQAAPILKARLVLATEGLIAHRPVNRHNALGSRRPIILSPRLVATLVLLFIRSVSPNLNCKGRKRPTTLRIFI